MTTSLIAAVRRRPGMSRRDFFDYILNVHADISTREPLTMIRYTQNHIVDSIAGQPGQREYAVQPDRDSVTVLTFADLPSMFATMGNPYTREHIGPDGANFSDLATAAALVTSNRYIQGAEADAPGETIIAFVNPLPGVDDDTLTAGLGALFDGAGSAFTSVQVGSRLAEGDVVVPYFGGADGIAYQGVVTITLPATDGTLARVWSQLVSTGVVDPARSFAALVDVKEITLPWRESVADAGDDLPTAT